MAQPWGRILLLATFVVGCAAAESRVVTPTSSAPAEPRAADVPAVLSLPPADPEVNPSTEPVSAERGWLGVELAPTEPTEGGVLVRSVLPGAPAEQAGVRDGDIILRLDGEPVSAPEDVIRVVGSRVAGQRVGVALRSQGQDRLIGVTLAARPDESGMLQMRFVGAPAPAFTGLLSVQGTLAPTLLSQRGKVVVVEFWSPYCVVCRLLAPVMNSWHRRYSPQGAEVIGIAAESVPQTAQAASGLGIDHPVFADPSGDTTRAYRAVAVPTVFIIDRQGVVRDVMVGFLPQKTAELEALIDRLLDES